MAVAGSAPEAAGDAAYGGSETYSIAVNEIVAIVANVVPGQTAKRIQKWNSSDETIAKVDARGIVTGVSPGNADIIVETDRDHHTVAVHIKVGTISRSHSLKSYKFQHDGHTYYIVDDVQRSWQEAAADAAGNGGHLVHINDSAEQRAIEKAIVDFDSFRKSSPVVVSNKLKYDILETYQSPTVPERGNIRYIWMGGTPPKRQRIWPGHTTSDSTEMSFTHWADIKDRKNPDNKTDPDYAAIALGNWSNGNLFQWNRIDGRHQLPYIIEIDKCAGCLPIDEAPIKKRHDSLREWFFLM